MRKKGEIPSGYTCMRWKDAQERRNTLRVYLYALEGRAGKEKYVYV